MTQGRHRHLCNWRNLIVDKSIVSCTDLSTLVAIGMLFHLIYVSTAVVPMTEDGLVQLLDQSRSGNGHNRLTGMLLYKNGHFMQVLEGEESTVMEIFHDIKKDWRHKSVDVLRAEYIHHRDFPDWTMGFANIDKLDSSTAPGFTRFLEKDFTSEYFSQHAVEAHAMLLAFKESPAG